MTPFGQRHKKQALFNLFARDYEYHSEDRGTGHHATMWGQEALASCHEAEAHTGQKLAGPGQYENRVASLSLSVPAAGGREAELG